ncbi:hypothetical protein [Ruegeria sp. MALMAid1280]|uniref:hypothetical protein n=1 Tax=Ruegeria sp. MALMAid1280 TaxID=3411634 RepID=UPI00147C876F|nr:hypothetical protein [uncultured Ruegeria sp.]
MNDMPQFNFGDRRKKFKVSQDCDEVEVSALKNGQSNPFEGVRNDLISGTLSDDVEMQLAGAQWQYEANAIENLSSEIVEEILRRAELLGSLYPFEFNGSTLSYSPTDHRLYEFLLVCSATKNITKGYNVYIPRNFERVAMEVSANFVGGDVEFMHVGWPRKNPNFRETWNEVHTRSGEWRWQPKVTLENATPPPAGDEGVDYVLWKAFGCGRPMGQLFFLGQCACGGDWDDKFTDINSKFFKWFDVPPVRPAHVFAVPHCLPIESIFEASGDAGIVLDRIRLVTAANLDGKYRRKSWSAVYKRMLSRLV